MKAYPEERYECCNCCSSGTDPDLHADPEFAGHDLPCLSCGQTWSIGRIA